MLLGAGWQIATKQAGQDGAGRCQHAVVPYLLAEEQYLTEDPVADRLVVATLLEIRLARRLALEAALGGYGIRPGYSRSSSTVLDRGDSMS